MGRASTAVSGIEARLTLVSCEVRVDTGDDTRPGVHARFQVAPWLPLSATALLAGLRAAGVVSWPWTWVTAPLWGTFLAATLTVAATVAAHVTFGDDAASQD